jgi:hypothetical protein
MSMKVSIVVFVVAVALIVGCGVQVPDVPEGDAVSYEAHLEDLVVARCLGCHGAEEPKAKLVLEQGTGYGQLVGRQSVQMPEFALVAPGDPEASYLWMKLQHSAKIEVGKGMPRTLTGVKKLPEAELELYRRWIAGGTLP